MNLYNHEKRTFSAAVRAWGVYNGDNPRYRIALCGYDGEHDMPGWHVCHWTAVASLQNRQRRPEWQSASGRLWFSPHCLL